MARWPAGTDVTRHQAAALPWVIHLDLTAACRLASPAARDLCTEWPSKLSL